MNRSKPEPAVLSDEFDPAVEYSIALLRACGVDLPRQNRDRPRSAPVEWARSGAMALTGSPHENPQFACGAVASAAVGAGLALRALAADARLAAIEPAALLGERAAIAGLSRRARLSVGGHARLMSTRRGDIVLNLPRDEDWQLLPALFEIDPQPLNSKRDWQTVSDLVSTHEPRELVERGRMMGLAIAPAARTIPVDPPLFRLQYATESAPPDRAPHRIRLLDLSNLWAGPLATSLLALAGVEVLKVESPTRPDGARNGPAAFFDLLNGGKLGCALDLHFPDDRRAFERLLETTDVVVESARPRGLANLGIDAANWVRARPGRIWTSITAYGRSKEWIGFGDDAAAAAGLAWPAGGSASGPRFCGDAIADPLAGLHAAVLILAHLKEGRGGLLDLSLVDITAFAARAENDGLVLPIDDSRRRSCVIEDGQTLAIEEPRARRVDLIAPPLAPPSEALIAHWTKTC